MEEKTLTQEQSIELISQMIRNTRNYVERNAGRPFLIWGYATVVTALAVWWAARTTNDPRWMWLWFALPIIGSVGMLLTRRPAEQHITTQIDRITGYVWIVCGLACSLCSLAAVFVPVRIPILFIVTLLVGIGTAITGLIIRYPLCTGFGFFGIVASGLLLAIRSVDACLLFAGVFAVMCVVPGHILNHKSNRSCRQRSCSNR